ncbi:hypothetical protein BZG36_02634 [Bifiguratus adelaidae]|uniref:ATP synthase subunit 5, mitochondrial n=1 Tax=Bifiguratus adelaidae TaxID=1938954 RepID=A0A261Y2U8_9FUNG|nr:hypothetical protein BZG36_02634 [Bifiguratus adelaidae]
MASRQFVGMASVARGYATAAKGASVQIPLTLNGIDGRYATALWTAAAKKSALENVEKELQQMQNVVAKDPKVQYFLENPTLGREQKREGVKALLKGGKYTDITRNFFDVLAENGRLSETSKIISGYQQLMQAHRGELPVTITSAKELDSATLKRLTDSLQKGKLSAGQKLIISNKVNPGIIGGLVVEFGDKTIDLSVSTRIAKLNKLVSDAV